VNFSTLLRRRANRHGIILNYFTQNGKYRISEKNTIAERSGDAKRLDGIDIAADDAAKIRNARRRFAAELLKDLGAGDEYYVEGEAATNRLDEMTHRWLTFYTRPLPDHINLLHH